MLFALTLFAGFAGFAGLAGTNAQFTGHEYNKKRCVANGVDEIDWDAVHSGDRSSIPQGVLVLRGFSDEQIKKMRSKGDCITVMKGEEPTFY